MCCYAFTDFRNLYVLRCFILSSVMIRKRKTAFIHALFCCLVHEMACRSHAVHEFAERPQVGIPSLIVVIVIVIVFI